MLKNRFLFFIFLSFTILSIHGQRLSEDARIGILTCGPGNELYAAFGHTAIHVCDTNKLVDIVFNYGTFDFHTPNFYIKFSQGRLPYMLSVSSFNDFIRSYQYEGRWVVEQELDLSYEEKEYIYDLLITNFHPENRYYAYDFFMDNCATRVRDMVEASLIERTAFQEHFPEHNTSFRDLIYPYLESMTWWRLGIDLALGMRCDKPISNLQYMFLPDELMNQLDTIKTKNESVMDNIGYHSDKLVASKTLLLKETRSPSSKGIPPFYVALLLCLIVIVLTVIEHKKKIYFKYVDVFLFGLFAILSLLIMYLWFCSDHHATKFNFNLLWANPLLIYILIRLQKSHKVILYIMLACIILPLFFFWGLPQYFNIASFPLMLLLAIRIGSLIKQKRELP